MPGGAARKLPSKEKLRRTAEFLMLIGNEDAAKVLSHLDSAVVEGVTREMLGITLISREEAARVMEEFSGLLRPLALAAGEGGFLYTTFMPPSGGVEAARRILHAAFGTEKGDALLEKSGAAKETNPFAFLEDYSAAQIALLFRDESAASAALVLSRLSSKLAAKVIQGFDEDKRREAVLRIARMKESPPEVLEKVAGALREKLRRLGTNGEEEAVDGKGALTAILKYADPSFGDKILSELESADGELGREIKERLFTLDDVVTVPDRVVASRLAPMKDGDIVLLTRGKSGAFREKILANLSEARRTRVLEEDEIMGPVSKIEAEAAAREFIVWFRENGPWTEDGNEISAGKVL